MKNYLIGYSLAFFVTSCNHHQPRYFEQSYPQQTTVVNHVASTPTPKKTFWLFREQKRKKVVDTYKSRNSLFKKRTSSRKRRK